jgi:hypothetical protein
VSHSAYLSTLRSPTSLQPYLTPPPLSSLASRAKIAVVVHHRQQWQSCPSSSSSTLGCLRSSKVHGARRPRPSRLHQARNAAERRRSDTSRRRCFSREFRQLRTTLLCSPSHVIHLSHLLWWVVTGNASPMSAPPRSRRRRHAPSNAG